MHSCRQPASGTHFLNKLLVLCPLTLVKSQLSNSSPMQPKAKAGKRKECPTSTSSDDGKKSKATRTSKNSSSNPAEEYFVEAILGRRTHSEDGIQYHVKWKGYERESDKTWEPLRNLAGSENMVAEFERQHEADYEKHRAETAARKAAKAAAQVEKNAAEAEKVLEEHTKVVSSSDDDQESESSSDDESGASRPGIEGKQKVCAILRPCLHKLETCLCG